MDGSTGSTAGSCEGSATALVAGGSAAVGGTGCAAIGSTTAGLGGIGCVAEVLFGVEDDHQ